MGGGLWDNGLWVGDFGLILGIDVSIYVVYGLNYRN